MAKPYRKMKKRLALRLKSYETYGKDDPEYTKPGSQNRKKRA